MLMIYNYLHQFLEEIDMPVNFGEKMVLKFKYYWTKTWMDRKHLFIFCLRKPFLFIQMAFFHLRSFAKIRHILLFKYDEVLFYAFVHLVWIIVLLYY